MLSHLDHQKNKKMLVDAKISGNIENQLQVASVYPPESGSSPKSMISKSIRNQ